MTKNFKGIKNITMYLIIGYVLGYIIYFASPQIYDYLTFNPYLIFKGQIWRVVTWILTMPESSPGIFTIIMLFLYYSLGTSLERAWGCDVYTKYILMGIGFTIIGGFLLYVILVPIYGGTMWTPENIGALISSGTSTYYINMSIFLAFALTFPDMKLLLYFIIPVKVKWFGYIYGIFILYSIYSAFKTSIGGKESIIYGITVTVMIVMSLLNFLIYFFKLKKNRISPREIKRKKEFRKAVETPEVYQYENGARHKCAVCGRTELDDDRLIFRYCSKCSGNKEYCQDHLFTHQHN